MMDIKSPHYNYNGAAVLLYKNKGHNIIIIIIHVHILFIIHVHILCIAQVEQLWRPRILELNGGV